MITSLTPQNVRDIFRGGLVNLEINKEYINSLNVFPVPDGDTGTNMSFTMVSAVKAVDAVKDDDVGALCTALAHGALTGARGNSGVILSLIFKGMSKILAESGELSTKSFARALKNGSITAYDVVSSPKEGTILTVIRLMSDYALKIANKKSNFVDFLAAILKKGEEILATTPDMLPILKKAGVVDAGGRGLLTIITGMYNVLAGVEMEPISSENDDISAEIVDAPLEFESLEDIKFAYCTEFFIINLFPKTTISDIDKLRDKLDKIGDSLIVVGDLDMVKVHVHTNHPDKALGYALLLGELKNPKIENMLEQHRDIMRAKEKKVKKPVGMVAICNGEGIKDVFKDLQVDVVVEGGQTMNPSVEDIVEAVNSVGAETVYILPNNGNIVLAAEQAKELTEAHLVVIATKNIPQGITAAMNFDPNASEEENVEVMREVIKNVRSGQITHAVRDTEMDGFELHSGDIIGLFNGIVAKGDSIDSVVEKTIAKMIDENTAAITLYYGEDVTQECAEVLADSVMASYPFFDVAVYEGGQQHYYYYISVE